MKTERTSRLPLFYTQGIGSLPRPQAVRDLLAQRREMEADRFQKTMGDMVRFAIALQEQAGMDVITDGEWRREPYVEGFLDPSGGLESAYRSEHQAEMKPRRVLVRRTNPGPPLSGGEARFVRPNTSHCVKFA